MEQQVRATKQMIDFQKLIFDSMMSSTIMLMDQTFRMFTAFVDPSPWVPEDTKKALRGLADGSRREVETFKNAVADGYDRLEHCIASCGA